MSHADSGYHAQWHRFISFVLGLPRTKGGKHQTVVVGLLCHSEKELSGQLIETDALLRYDVAQSCSCHLGLN